jgi:hypothetical protein
MLHKRNNKKAWQRQFGRGSRARTETSCERLADSTTCRQHLQHPQRRDARWRGCFSKLFFCCSQRDRGLSRVYRCKNVPRWNIPSTRRLVASTSSVETPGSACVSANYFSAPTHPPETPPMSTPGHWIASLGVATTTEPRAYCLYPDVAHISFPISNITIFHILS